MQTNGSFVIALIEQAGVPALRIAFTIAVMVFLFGGYLIFRKQHQFFDRDPNVPKMCQSSDTIVRKQSYLSRVA